jgi:hypothetical protein
MGSACKADPSRIQICDLNDTEEDALARAVRTKLRQRGVTTGIPVIYSTERPQVQAVLDESVAADNPSDFAILPSFRVRILPVLGALPAMFGSAMAAYALCQLADFPLEPVAHKNRTTLYQRLLKDLVARYKSDVDGTYMTAGEVGWLYDEVCGGRSIVSGRTDKLVLVRWDPREPPRLGNVVVMTKEEAAAHDVNSDETISDAVQKCFDRCRARNSQQ